MDVKENPMEESIKYHIPEEIPANERTAFHGAAAAAAKAGKKSFNFGGKTHPVTMNKDLANKIAILGMNEGWGIDYVKITYRRWFEEGKEPATEPNLSEIMQEMKLNKDKVLKKVEASDIEATNEKNTNTAFKSGVFGSPTFIYDGEVFWGDDRLEDCIKWIKLQGE